MRITQRNYSKPHSPPSVILQTTLFWRLMSNSSLQTNESLVENKVYVVW